MSEQGRNIANSRLRALQMKGYEICDVFAYPVSLYHQLNPAHAYDPDHAPCYVMLCRDGRLLKSRYGDDWEIATTDAGSFETFINTVPNPTLWRRAARRIGFVPGT